MRSVGLSILAITILALGAAAQERETAKPALPGELRTVKGCLSKVAQTFVITAGVKGPRQFRVVGGDTSEFAGKLGYTVEVVGVVGESGPLNSVAPPFYAGSTTGVGYSTIVAQKTRVFYGNCSEPGKEWPGDHE